MPKRTSRRKMNQRMVYTVIILAVGGLVLSSAIAYFGTGPVIPNTGDQSSATAIANLEYQIGQYETSLEKAPDNFFLLTQLGNSYYQLGQEYGRVPNEEKAIESFAKAIEPYGKALELEPEDVNVRVDRATAAYYSGSYDLAEQEYIKSIEIDGTHVNAQFNYGVFLYFARNNSVKAIEQWNKVIELNPADSQLLSAARSLIAQAEADMNELRGDPSQFDFSDEPQDNNGNSGN